MSIKIGIMEKDGVEYTTPTEMDLAAALATVGLTANAIVSKKIETPLSSTSALVLTQVNDLTIPLETGKTYNIKYLLAVSSADRNQHLTLQFTSNAILSYTLGNIYWGETVTTLRFAPVTAINTIINLDKSIANNTKQLDEINLVVKCTVSGNFNLNFRARSAGKLVTLHEGTIVTYSEV
jgi:hypothetical protein